MERKFFSIYIDVAAALFEQLTDAQLGKFLRACVVYSQGGDVAGIIGEDVAVTVAWSIYKTTLDRDAEKYAAKCEKNKANVRKRYERIQSYTNEYERIQSNTNGYYNYNYNDNENNNYNESSNAREEIAPADLKKLFSSKDYAAYREQLAITYRALTPDQINAAIAAAVNFMACEGKVLTIGNAKRYINKECAFLASRPAGTIAERRERFARECAALKDINADPVTAAAFLKYYTQPATGKNKDLMLFETFEAWDTVTRYKLFAEHGKQS